MGAMLANQKIKGFFSSEFCRLVNQQILGDLLHLCEITVDQKHLIMSMDIFVVELIA